MQKKEKTKVSLVLGSGGARGLAHIGVIHWLEDNNYEIKSISGCSMGSVIGGIYAAGKLDIFENWIKNITKTNMISLLDISWGTSGIVKGDKIINTLKKLLGDRNIEDLPISFTAVAADIKREKEIWINSGPLFDALRASVSLPLFFTPFNYNGVELIDGGVLNPVPIAPTFGDDTDITIAVNLGGAVINSNNNIVEEEKEEPSALQKIISSVIDGFKPTKTKNKESNWSMYDIANQAFDAMQSTIARQKLAAYPPDYEIIIARDAYDTFDFDLAKDIIDLGYSKINDTLGNKLIK